MSKFEKIIDKNREKRFNKARRLVENKEFTKAEKIYQELIKSLSSYKDKRYYSVIFTLIKLYSITQNYIKSFPLITEAVSYYRNKEDKTIIGSLYNELSIVYDKFGDISKAKIYCEKSLKIAQGNFCEKSLKIAQENLSYKIMIFG